jgi:hypothetical protein
MADEQDIQRRKGMWLVQNSRRRLIGSLGIVFDRGSPVSVGVLLVPHYVSTLYIPRVYLTIRGAVQHDISCFALPPSASVDVA